LLGIAAAAPIPSLPPRALATPLLPMASTLCLPAQAALQPPVCKANKTKDYVIFY